ncbi:TPA: hypothetical protein QFE13_002633, partial [Enterococcus faecium]
MSFQEIYRGMENGAEVINQNFKEAVDTSSNQSIDGFKDFQQTPTIKGVNLAKETFGITLTGGQLGGVEVREGTVLKWGIP